MLGQEASRSRPGKTVLHTPTLFASLFAATRDAVVITDRQQRIQLVNARFEELIGVDGAAVEGVDIHELFESGSGSAGPAGPFSTIHRIARRREVSVEMRRTEILDEDGEPVGYYFFVRDVTNRRTAEEALRASERQYRSLFEQANDALIIFEPAEERILEVNPRACELYGFTRGEFIGRSLQKLTENVDRGRHAIDDILVNGGIRDFESRHFRKDGSPLSLQISCSLIQFDRRRAVLTIIRDVSEQKKAERALREAKEAAEKATRLKSDFVARISHEIRTPMNGVIGMSELLMQTPLNDSQRDCAKSITRSGESLLKLVDDLLDFSKIEAGKLELEHVPFDPHRMTGEIAELFAARAEKKGNRIAFYVDPDVPPAAIGDPHRIRQVLTNLVSNAVKFTDGGEIIITVTAEGERNERTALVYEVADTGIGIPAGQQGRLFEAFTQADTDTTRKFGGTGLGLAISRQLVSLMGGSIDLRSVYGEGSTFRFSVLVDRLADARAAVEIVKADGANDADSASLRGLRVLIADPNRSVRGIVCCHLDAWNVHVEEASSADEAVDTIRAAPDGFDAMLIERSLFGDDVAGSAQRLRRACTSGEPHIILLTAFMDRTVADLLSDVGVDACLATPLWPNRLRQCLATAAHEGRRSNGTPSPRTESDAISKDGGPSFHSDSAARTRDSAATHSSASLDQPGAATNQNDDATTQRNIAADRHDDATTQHNGAPVPTTNANAAASEGASSPSILLVEDNRTNQRVAKAMLRRCGVEIDIATNGLEAVEKVAQTPYDLILMDCQMPVMDGFEATRRIRNLPGSSGLTPIIAVTANAMQGDRDRCLSVGMDDYLTKPFRPEVLRSTLDRWLPGRLAA